MHKELPQTNPAIIPNRYDAERYEKAWQQSWEESRIYHFDPEDLKKPVFSIDTPPPYPTGELHMGHVINWCYFDFIARHKRMQGFNVHFPQGWDCHGLPTEVRVETAYKIKKSDLPVEEFRRLCAELTVKNIAQMKNTLKALGFSIDWNLEYRTMDPEYKRLSQLAFIILYKKGLIYRGEHPVNWCPRCETAIAEAEVEYTQKDGRLYTIRFETANGYVPVATTRPELLPACVALAVNTEDGRHRSLMGAEAKVPLTDRKVPILADHDVDPDFGTGVVMICTFGDKTDVKWQKRHGLPTIRLLMEDGSLSSLAGPYESLSIDDARLRIVEDLKSASKVEGMHETVRNVGGCWRCHTPVEIISKPQWFMRTREMTDQIIWSVDQVRWVPEFAKKRMIDWANSLDWDWVISRQRIFATPIPIWWCTQCRDVLVAEEDQLPVDPRYDRPRNDKCPRCGSMQLEGERDVMDTWMDSSITCAVHAGWPSNIGLFDKLFPASLQSNGADIIRTWDYYLMVKHLALFGKPPYKTVLINGMVRGIDGRMMHRHYGNYVEAAEALRKYGADALRQWAAGGGSTGYDIPFKWSDVEYGKKFLTKLWNAFRLVALNTVNFSIQDNATFETLDRWILSLAEKLTDEVSEAYEQFQFNAVIDKLRSFVWHVYCDQYIEAVKYRLYEAEEQRSPSRYAAQYTLLHVLDRIIKLLAPICPHITETMHQSMPSYFRAAETVHLSAWPQSQKNLVNEEAESSGSLLVAVISETRRAKSEKHLSLKSPVKEMRIYAVGGKEMQNFEENSEAIRKICNVDALKVAPLSEAENEDGNILRISQDVSIALTFTLESL